MEITSVQPQAGRPRRPPRPGPAEHWILPGLVVAMVVGNQGWAIGPFLMGQMISWTVNLAAFVVLVRFFPRRAWPWLLLCGIVLARLLEALGLAGFDVAYKVFLNVQFCAAGAVVAYRYAGLTLRQLRWICLASVIMMVLQATGAGEWTQVLATENEGRPLTAYPTLFVPYDQLQYQTVQARPSGPLHSNNFLSLIVLFALALQYSSKSTSRLNRWDLVLAMMAVLSMARIVFLVTGLLVVWLLVMGTTEQRVRMRRVIVLFLVLFAAYKFLMPGQFESQINTERITYSYYIRINDFLDRLAPDNPLVTLLTPYLVNTPRLDRDAGETGFSGYSQALKAVPLIVGAFVLLVPTFRRALRGLRRRVSDLSSIPVLTGFVVLVYPGAVPFLTAQIFWFVAGFACLPLLVLALPKRRPLRDGGKTHQARGPQTQPVAAAGGPQP